MNTQQLIERSHRQSVDKGFWDVPMSFHMAMALISSEIMEALEAYRKGRINPDWNDTQAVKESFEVELADGEIRIKDWCGRHNYEIEIEDINYTWSMDEGENFMLLLEACVHAWRSDNKESSMEDLFNVILSYSNHHKVDIERYIEWKLDYNMSRPYKHGKQF